MDRISAPLTTAPPTVFLDISDHPTEPHLTKESLEAHVKQVPDSGSIAHRLRENGLSAATSIGMTDKEFRGSPISSNSMGSDSFTLGQFLGTDSSNENQSAPSSRTSRASSIDDTTQEGTALAKLTPEQKAKRSRIHSILLKDSLASFPAVRESLENAQDFSLKNVLSYFFKNDTSTEKLKQRESLLSESRSQIFNLQEKVKPDDLGDGTWREVSDEEALKRATSERTLS